MIGSFLRFSNRVDVVSPESQRSPCTLHTICATGNSTTISKKDESQCSGVVRENSGDYNVARGYSFEEWCAREGANILFSPCS